MEMVKVVFSRWYDPVIIFTLFSVLFCIVFTFTTAYDVFTITTNFHFKGGNKGNRYTIMHSDCNFANNYLYNKNREVVYT